MIERLRAGGHRPKMTPQHPMAQLAGELEALDQTISKLLILRRRTMPFEPFK
jgi:hypothetical protein